MHVRTDLVTACNIAKQCGILTKNGTVMEGVEFRRLSPAQVSHFGPVRAGFRGFAVRG